jgi:hypothetical protein
MHAAIQLLGFWALAFITLGLAVVLLGIFSGLIGNDLELHSLGKEAAIAATASLIEALSLWLILTYIPSAARAMILPALIVSLVYKVGHFEDWSGFDVFLLMVFQLVIASVGMALRFGHFQTAILILMGFAFILAVIAGFTRGL